jgi:signal transduction histidine kinase
MSLVTRFSAFFLLALALMLVGFSVSIYFLIAMRLYQSLDYELDAKLDRFEAGPEFDDSRVSWAYYDENGHPLTGSQEFVKEVLLDDHDVASFRETVPFSIAGRAGSRWRVLLRHVLDGRRRRGQQGTRRAIGGGARSRGDQDSPPGRDHPPARWVAAGARLGTIDADLLALAVVLTIISLSLWGLAAAIGRYFGQRALAPLTRMAEAARAMPWAEGDRRLPSLGTRDELEDFGGSFNGLLDRLHEALERQKQFTGQASHQLRTPLAGVIAAIEVARRRTRTVQEHEQVLDRVHGDSIRLWRVVEALLFLARADADAGLPDLERFDLVNWTADHLLRWSGHERSADLQGAEAPPCPLWIRAHRPLLGQLLDNLLENACKYSGPGCPIVVRVWSEPRVVALAVEDSGGGIPGAELPHLFEPFFRSEQARRLGQPGVGLGLAVVHRIASALGGTVSAESEPGRGSRFVVRLPEALSETEGIGLLVSRTSRPG